MPHNGLKGSIQLIYFLFLISFIYIHISIIYLSIYICFFFPFLCTYSSVVINIGEPFCGNVNSIIIIIIIFVKLYSSVMLYIQLLVLLLNSLTKTSWTKAWYVQV